MVRIFFSLSGLHLLLLVLQLLLLLLLGLLLLLVSLQQRVSEGNVARFLLLSQGVKPILQHSLPAAVSITGQQHGHEGASACTGAIDA